MPRRYGNSHMPHGITQCYLPPGRGNIPAQQCCQHTIGETASTTHRRTFLPARRYANAGTNYVTIRPHRCYPVSLSVCLSLTSRCSIEMNGRVELVCLICRLLSTYPSLCYKEIQVSAKISVLPSGTLSKTPDLENFAPAYRSS